jgi:hypothetical protein
MSLKTRTTQLIALRNRIRDAEAKLSALKDRRKTLEDDVLAEMLETGIDMVRTKDGGSISRVTQEVPQIKDYDAFWKFVRRSNKPELLQRRVSTTAWREVKELRRDGKVPGVETFEKVSLSLREKRPA